MAGCYIPRFSTKGFLQLAEQYGADIELLHRSFDDSEPEYYSFNHDATMYSLLIEAVRNNARMLILQRNVGEDEVMQVV